jgi:hypothetical protein
MTDMTELAAGAEVAPIGEGDTVADMAESPQFYDLTEPLTAEKHGAWRLLPGDLAFARDANSVMLAASEFAAASRSYPILFAGNDGLPIALLGLERHNDFVASGRWAADSYVPAYIRRHPFIFYATEEPQRFVLGIDVASPRIARGGDRGVALFDGDAASAATAQALQFCEAFRRDCAVTRLFADALLERDLLVDRRAAVTLPGGGAFDIDGFKLVDRDRFDALDDATVLDWHRKGWLAAIQFHFASLDRFQALLDRRAGAVTAPSAHSEGTS